MQLLYKSKYYGDLSYFLRHGWTIEEVNTYFPFLENLSDLELLDLHKLCGVKMFSSGELVDQEQAMDVLVNPSDTPKQLLFNAIENLKTGNGLHNLFLEVK